jgi:hypothetical protein
MMPHLLHSVVITDKVCLKWLCCSRHHLKSHFLQATGISTTQKHYNYGPFWKTTGESWWSTYRYMWESFARKCKGDDPVHWVPAEDSIQQMEVIDAIYGKSGLGRRHGTVVPGDVDPASA